MTIRLWDLRTKQCLRVFEGHLGQVQCIQALGNRFVSGSLDNTIRIWDLETGQCLKTLFGHVEGVWCVRFDKLRIVSGAHDKTVKVRVIPLLPSPPLPPVHLAPSDHCLFRPFSCRSGMPTLGHVFTPSLNTPGL